MMGAAPAQDRSTSGSGTLTAKGMRDESCCVQQTEIPEAFNSNALCVPISALPLLSYVSFFLAEKERNEDLKYLKNKTKSNTQTKPHKIRKLKYLPGISWLKQFLKVLIFGNQQKEKWGWVAEECRVTGVQHQLSNSSWQRHKHRTGREQPYSAYQTLFTQPEADQILPHRSAKFPLHFLQGSQDCAEAAVLLPGHYWWEEKKNSKH